MQSDFDGLSKLNTLLQRDIKSELFAICAVQNYINFKLTPQETEKLRLQWQNIVMDQSKKGKRIKYVQVCKVPLTETMLNYLRFGLKPLDRFGELHLAIDFDTFTRIATDWDINKEYWLIDYDRLVELQFTKEGAWLGFKESRDPKLIKEIARIKKRCLSKAVSIDNFLIKHGDDEKLVSPQS